ncbi:DUF2487 family protein [Paenibacillus sp. M1]|uniref:DUF2487 family protein n=1 Tax=Paenibacillus haidiansis TaxID=1574488 RepID=A0ABU7VLV4_9BACL
MKFSEMEPGTWEELRPYLDTCLIPVTGLTGKEQPHEVTAALERLRDIMDLVEIPFHGRIVTYPSFQYGREEILSQVNEICHHVKSGGFRYAIVISTDVEPENERLPAADLIITPERFPAAGELPAGQRVKDAVQRLWKGDSKI